MAHAILAKLAILHVFCSHTITVLNIEMCVRKASVQSKHRSQELMDFRFRENEDHEDVN